MTILGCIGHSATHHYLEEVEVVMVMVYIACHFLPRSTNRVGMTLSVCWVFTIVGSDIFGPVRVGVIEQNTV